MGKDRFNTGLKATNDIYARATGLVPRDKVENPVEVEETNTNPVTPEDQGLQKVEGAQAPKTSTASKTTTAKKTAAKKTTTAKKTAAKK